MIFIDGVEDMTVGCIDATGWAEVAVDDDVGCAVSTVVVLVVVVVVVDDGCTVVGFID